MSVDVRTIGREEFEAWLAALRTGFLDGPATGEAEFIGGAWDLGRARGAFAGDRIVGTLRSFASELTVPGGRTVPVSALTNVTVTATHRRQGLASRMVAGDLRDSAERGEVASILIAAEYPIYGRFGYGPATWMAEWELDASVAAFRVGGSGDVELVDPVAFRAAVEELWGPLRRGRAGGITRDALYWDAVSGVRERPGAEHKHRFRAVCREGGRPTGLLSYTIDKKWEGMRPRCSLQVDLLFALSTQALARLWRYCAEVDWVTTVKAEARPEDELLPWLLVDGRHARLLSREDMVWLRPLDVPGLLSARRLGGDGRIVMEVKDPDGYAAGRFELEGSVEGSACRPAGATPAVTLSPGALGTLALGGGSAATLQAAGWIEEHEPGGVAMLDRLLGWPQPPWTPIWF